MQINKNYNFIYLFTYLGIVESYGHYNKIKECTFNVTF